MLQEITSVFDMSRKLYEVMCVTRHESHVTSHN